MTGRGERARIGSKVRGGAQGGAACFGIHVIWKYGNYALVSLLRECICNHTLGLTKSAFLLSRTHIQYVYTIYRYTLYIYGPL